MKKNVVKVDVEINKNGLWASVENIPGFISKGNSLVELKNNFYDGLQFHLDMNDKKFKSYLNKNEFIFDYDFKSLFEYLHKMIKPSYISEKLNISPSLFSQYKSGKKEPSEKRKYQILKQIKSIGNEINELA